MLLSPQFNQIKNEMYIGKMETTAQISTSNICEICFTPIMWNVFTRKPMAISKYHIANTR